MEKICVAIRVRPPSKAGSPAPSLRGHRWSVGPHNVALYSTLGTPVTGQSYSFDHVFGTDAKNEDVHRGLAKDVIMSSLNGFNGTVFAYGQTSSGKTYTMKGTPTDPGIIRLGVHDVFRHIREMTNNREFLIRVSYMEIYNEEINDLFAPDNRRLRIHENLEKGIFVAGLREEIVDSPEQVFNLLEFGENHRHFGETNMNLYSSRSHTIFRMVIESRDSSQDGCEVEASSDAVRVSCLNMVDLAGSERIAKTGAGGVRLKEGTHINKSLMTLGTVINKLSDGTGKQGGHIPYRDSKLTRILQPALGGNAKTAMICTVTPDEIHVDETRGTLQFASRAKRVSTCAQVNEIVTDAALLKRQTREIEDLRMKLQGLPQSAHLEKEILTLRNELLKFELEKERLNLELQEEKRAQVERERRIKEQEQKIENLSTLFMSSTLDDRDVEKLHKKVNRRETWCPRLSNSKLPIQDFRKSVDQVDQIEDDETMDNMLYSMRRDRTFTLPPAFEVDEEADPFWTGSDEIEEPEPPSNFENIADEDTWMSLNKGHTTTSTVFTPGFSERNRSSTGSLAAQKVINLEIQLKDSQVRCKELESSCDNKIQESTKELREEVKRIQHQLDKVQDENLNLKNELSAQLEMQRELQYVLEDLEFEMDAARLQTGSMQGIVAESLHVQAKMLLTIQNCMTGASTKGKHSSPLNMGPKLDERRLSMERSVEQCRQICAEAEHGFQDQPSRMQENLPHSYIEVLDGDPYTVDNLGVRRTIDFPESDESPEHRVFDSPPLENITTASVLSEVNFCEDCMSSVLSASRTWYNGQAVLCDHSEHRSCQDSNDSEMSGGNSSLERCDSAHEAVETCSLSQGPSLDMGYKSLSSIPSNGLRAHALRALALDADTQSERGSCKGKTGGDYTDPTGIWSGFISCQHVGCSFGTLGRNCDYCANQERTIMGKNQIPSAMSKLCSLILKLFEPSFPTLDAVRVQHNEEEIGVTQKGTLKTRLASAKLLATWLLEDVQGIAGHDVDCLNCHVKERGNVGILLETVQVLLLQIANVGVGLLQATCQDEDLRKDLLLQLSTLKDARKDMPNVAEGMQLAEPVSPNLQQGDTTVQKAPQPIYDERDTTVVEIVEESFVSSPSMFLDRVLKVEGVEEVLGKVLQNSMVPLSKEHRVMEGDPMSLVLTVDLDPSHAVAKILLHEQDVGEKGQQLRIAATTGDSSWKSIISGKVLQARRLSAAPFCCSSSTGRLLSGNLDSAHEYIRFSNQSTTGGKCKSGKLSLYEGKSVTVRNSGDLVEEMGNNTELNFAAQLLLKTEKVGELEMNLAAAELEIVELKIELEDLRAKLQTYGDIARNQSVQQMQLELQSYKDQCENYREEIRLVLEQFPSSAESLQKERHLMEVMQENQYLQGCLAKAKKHVLRSKAWRDEIRTWKDIGKAATESQAVSVQDLRASSNEPFVGSKGCVEAQQPQFGAVHVESAPCLQKEEGKTKDAVRPARAALRVLDLNVRNDDVDVCNNPKRRRQLQFWGEENFSKVNPSI